MLIILLGEILWFIIQKGLRIFSVSQKYTGTYDYGVVALSVACKIMVQRRNDETDFAVIHHREDGPSGEALPAVVLLCEANGVASGVNSFKALTWISLF